VTSLRQRSSEYEPVSLDTIHGAVENGQLRVLELFVLVASSGRLCREFSPR
jgi:hypothetical protein